jgi:hypothetical protein
MLAGQVRADDGQHNDGGAVGVVGRVCVNVDQKRGRTGKKRRAIIIIIIRSVWCCVRSPFS